jgi:hypothetical protein
MAFTAAGAGFFEDGQVLGKPEVNGLRVRNYTVETSTPPPRLSPARAATPPP